ncbi:MAG: ATP-binding cassette domain-containing protein [Paludibacteraceae bacterium]|nr:ATP-binding cassette domain-containing protein [Paludibacteraceae bacterium]
MISVENVSKNFEGHAVLKGISCVMHDGQCNMIIGQSGSGKTVLMKSVIGLHQIDAGRIEYDGRNLPDMNPHEVRDLRREVGMLFQGSALFDSMSVLGNVMFPLEMFSSMTQIEMEKRAKFCLGRVNIQDHAWNLSPGEISGGMQKRVAIARAIAMNPKYLFCDEPNSGLDPKTSLVIDQLIHEITVEYNICTIINSHDMNSILEIGDNIIFLKEGRLGWMGPRTDVYTKGNEDLNDFVFASDLFKKVKQVHDIQL